MERTAAVCLGAAGTGPDGECYSHSKGWPCARDDATTRRRWRRRRDTTCGQGQNECVVVSTPRLQRRPRSLSTTCPDDTRHACWSQIIMIIIIIKIIMMLCVVSFRKEQQRDILETCDSEQSKWWTGEWVPRILVRMKSLYYSCQSAENTNEPRSTYFDGISHILVVIYAGANVIAVPSHSYACHHVTHREPLEHARQHRMSMSWWPSQHVRRLARESAHEHRALTKHTRTYTRTPKP